MIEVEKIDLGTKEISTVSDWLEVDDQICVDTVDRKYLWGENILGHKETVTEFLYRVSCYKKKYLDIIGNLFFIPGGRILANIDLNKLGIKCTYSNCYVIAGPEDNIESIYEVAKKMARTFSYGGGVGIDISRLAPKDARVRNTAEYSTGSVSFCETYSEVANTIGQNARRGALMICIRDDHPDLMQFITHKSDLNLTTGANMSVKMSDKFFETLKQGPITSCKYNITDDSSYVSTATDHDTWLLHFERPETGEKIEKYVNPNDVMDLIAKTVWDFGEPGVLFWDTINNYCLLGPDPDFKYEATNPCVSGDTLILTDMGYIPIEKTVGYKVNIWNGFEWSLVEPVITGTNQHMRALEFSDGTYIKCTDYHKFIMSDGSRKEAKDLRPGDKLAKHEFPIIEGVYNIDTKLAYTKGFFAGDGCVDNRNRNVLYLYGDKMNLLPFLEYKTMSDHSEDDKNRITLYLDAEKYKNMQDKFFVPNAQFTIDARLSWLAGYIDADGNKNSDDGSIAITSINLNFLKDVKYLLNTLGCNGKISMSHDIQMKPLPDGKGGMKEYMTKPAFRLIISAFNVSKLMQLGLRTHRVALVAEPNRDASRFITVRYNLDGGTEPVVYCFNEPKNHSGVFNGIMTAQCGELPLPNGGACLLGALNLSRFFNKNNVKINSNDKGKYGKTFKIDNQDFKGKVTIDEDVIDNFEYVVHTAIQYLDEVLSKNANLHPLKEQRESVKMYRPIGLGIMGLADAFVQCEIKYGSTESILLSDVIGYIMAFNAIEESCHLAKVKGKFQKCKPEYIVESEFYKYNVLNNPCIDKKRINALHNDILKYGLRNSQLLTIAPTGTTSTIINVSGGIEPIFSNHYTRTTKSISKDGDKTYEVYPNIVMDYALANPSLFKEDGTIDIDKLPEYFVTSKDIFYRDRIDIQSVWQSHIDNSISSTVNLPEKTTVEEIRDLYIYAYEKKLKGITVFREGCKRMPILKNVSDKEKDNNEDVKNIPYKIYYAIYPKNIMPTALINIEWSEAVPEVISTDSVIYVKL